MSLLRRDRLAAISRQMAPRVCMSVLIGIDLNDSSGSAAKIDRGNGRLVQPTESHEFRGDKCVVFGLASSAGVSQFSASGFGLITVARKLRIKQLIARFYF